MNLATADQHLMWITCTLSKQAGCGEISVYVLFQKLQKVRGVQRPARAQVGCKHGVRCSVSHRSHGSQVRRAQPDGQSCVKLRASRGRTGRPPAERRRRGGSRYRTVRSGPAAGAQLCSLLVVLFQLSGTIVTVNLVCLV